MGSWVVHIEIALLVKRKSLIDSVHFFLQNAWRCLYSLSWLLNINLLLSIGSIFQLFLIVGQYPSLRYGLILLKHDKGEGI